MRSIGAGNVAHVSHRVAVSVPPKGLKHCSHTLVVRGNFAGWHRKHNELPFKGRVHTRHSRGKRTSNDPEIQSKRPRHIARVYRRNTHLVA